MEEVEGAGRKVIPESRRKVNKKQEPKPKYNMWQNTAYYIAFAWREKEKKIIFLGLIFAGFVVANNLVNLFVSPTILGIVERREPVLKLILTILGFTGAKMFCSAGLSYIRANMPYGKITLRIAVLEHLIQKTMTTSFPNVNDDKFIKLIAKCRTVTNDNDKATEAIWGTLTTLLHDGICFLIYLFLLSSVSVWMIVVVLATSVAGYFVSRYVNGYEYRHREELSGYEKQMWYISNRARDYSAAKDIRIFGMGSWLSALGDKALASYMAFKKRAEGVYIWARIADLLLTFLRNGIAYFYLIGRVVSGDLLASQFLLYFSAVGGFTVYVCGILKSLAELHQQSLDLCIVRECLEYPESFRFEDGDKIPKPGAGNWSRYEIRLEHVSFCYPGSDRDTLTDINLTLHPGEKLAIVGVNGAGKTTLVRLICGLYDPTKGRVLLNGRDIREFDRNEYYNLFSAVFQNFNILAGTIAANIAQTEDGVDLKKVQECVEEAGLTKKIESLGEKYDTLLNRMVYEDAAEFSGGETQRLMLARALYKDAPIIVLDEPTAALDPIAESELYQKYNEMTQDRLAVYISHRLASTRFCDRIILLEDRSIVEEGTHEELIRKGGRYAELFYVQSKYYQENSDAKERKQSGDRAGKEIPGISEEDRKGGEKGE
ncbi:MAG: ABC transporter ATP-binding protein/permease [Lachnospiraceae bacterium]|nr:ABC transporter ATP-binding protein/permease [Lachnospiraceae bacterium]